MTLFKLGPGLLTSKIQKTIDNVIRPGQSQLGGFASIFSTSLGASAGGSNLQQALTGSVSQVFGRAGNGILGKPNAIPGFNVAAITTGLAQTSEDEGIEYIGSVIDSSWKPNIDKSVNLVRSIKNVLPDLVEKKTVNGFSSLFKDYNSMVTQGYGNLTDNLTALGIDLFNLGKIGDLTDLLNIGTARQLARQLVENGLGVTSGLVPALNQNGLSILSIQNEQSEQIVYDILKSITDPTIIADVKSKMNIKDTLVLSNLADLLDTSKVLPLSDQYNYFSNIQDMALTLLLAGNGNGIGVLKSLGDLGQVLFNMETAEQLTALLDEYHLIRYDESEVLREDLPPTSMFNLDGPVVADFIGTAAGYIHNYSLEKMAELHDEIFNNALMTPYKDLMTVLTATLNGDYSDALSVNPPSTAKYTIGSWPTLDEAVTALIALVETELAYVAATAPTADPIFWRNLQIYESHHNESARFLAHEKKMRETYGIDLGDPHRVTSYYGDGVTASFPLEAEPTSGIFVTVDGVYKVQTKDYTFNAATNSVVMTTIPTVGQVVSFQYDVNAIAPSKLPADTWQLASSIEDHALQTGYGGPADFLNKITTDDRHGQRIKAIMMQARNKVRLESVGIACPGFNRVLNENDSKDFNFIERTGIWSTNTDRAAEIWLQRNEGVESTEEYVINKLQQNAAIIKPDNDLLMRNVTRQLIFLNNNQLVMTEKLAQIYANSLNSGIFLPDRSDMILGYNITIPTVGYALGDYQEILSAICKAEGFDDPNFNLPLNATTRNYLEKIGIDLDLLTSVLQRTLLINLSSSMGLSEETAVSIFGIQSASRNILLNISNSY